MVKNTDVVSLWQPAKPTFLTNDELWQSLRIMALTPEQNSASGDYELKAIFSCLNNGQWYNFENSKDYHVKSGWEKFELSYNTITIVISVIALLSSIYAICIRKAK